MKEEFEKSGWMNEDSDEIDIHVKHHGKSHPHGSEWDKEEKSKWDDFISSTKKIVGSLKDDASDWYNGKSKGESSEESSASSKSSSTKTSSNSSSSSSSSTTKKSSSSSTSKSS